MSLYGVKYHQNNAATGTWLNLNRATYPQQLATPRVNAANSALVPSYVRLAINKVRKALGIGQLGQLVAYTSVEQEHAWENLGITISQVIKEGAGGRANDLDLLFSGRKTMSGVPIKSSINADQTRVDFLDLSHWGRAVMKDIDFFEIGGQTVFPIYGSREAFPPRSFFTSTPGFRFGTILRAAERTSTAWLGPPATNCPFSRNLSRPGTLGNTVKGKRLRSPASALIAEIFMRAAGRPESLQRAATQHLVRRSLKSTQATNECLCYCAAFHAALSLGGASVVLGIDCNSMETLGRNA